MKKTLALFTLLLFVGRLWSQESTPASPNITVKWAPTGMVLGNISVQGEYNFGGRNSLTAKIGLPVSAHHSFTYDDKDANFNFKATSFLAGYRTYLSKKHLQGLYYEPYFKYVHHTSEGTGSGALSSRKAVFNFTNDYNGVGLGFQLGAQFLIGKHVVVDLFFLGPEINSASNTFKAIEVSNTIPWTDADMKDVEIQIREFINQFPFIRNRTSVMVDRENKLVVADFKGAIPGIRTGISIGFAF
ncbi:MAG TPA: hypothetical protein VFL47_02755 [Flavisolibacter sp.]|nr:hypothetical protein [Flavisolibacter sp.]